MTVRQIIVTRDRKHRRIVATERGARYGQLDAKLTAQCRHAAAQTAVAGNPSRDHKTGSTGLEDGSLCFSRKYVTYRLLK